VVPINEYNIFLEKGHCAYCNNTLIIFRKYSGEKLCPDCFQKSIEKTIYKTISKYKMLNRDEKIVVGISGGKDSLTLLYNLKQIQENTYTAEPPIALSIDEGIKGYRSNSLENVKKTCKELGIESKIISFKEKIGYTLDEIINLKKQDKDSRYACNYCALIRRRLLNDGAKELGGDVLALGHNLTDIAETYLMNILYKRFQLIANQYLFKKHATPNNSFFVRKITPLMRIPEEEIFLYANLKKINYYPSHCPYRESDPIIRKRVLNFIQECKKYSPEIEFNLFNGFLEMSEVFYKNFKRTNFNRCTSCSYPCGVDSFCSYCRLKKELP